MATRDHSLEIVVPLDPIVVVDETTVEIPLLEGKDAMDQMAPETGELLLKASLGVHLLAPATIVANKGTCLRSVAYCADTSGKAK